MLGGHSTGIFVALRAVGVADGRCRWPDLGSKLLLLLPMFSCPWLFDNTDNTIDTDCIYLVYQIPGTPLELLASCIRGYEIKVNVTYAQRTNSVFHTPEKKLPRATPLHSAPESLQLCSSDLLMRGRGYGYASRCAAVCQRPQSCLRFGAKLLENREG